jgi:2-polyprenyl-6-methoxyphenol hydroxylase-like FAD-dependent oxidoreductase
MPSGIDHGLPISLMRVAILGAGPAGLYLGYLLKRRRPDWHVRIFEQNAPDATFGFGVVFSDRALEFLNEDDPDTHAAIAPHLESWRDITVNHRGNSIAIDGIGFTAIGRLRLLRILQERAHGIGAEISFRRPVTRLTELGDADLIVGADGVNSVLRASHGAAFGATVSYLNSRFAWFGTSRPFATLTQTFVETPQGHFNAHHYRHAPDMSTFVVEVDETTFFSTGLDRMDEAQSKALCENVFAEQLQGAPLISNRSVWRQFPCVRNERWSYGNCVLIGDALHTAHFSIGSGTRLAMEDAIALDRALAAHGDDIPMALRNFEANRRPVLDKLVAAANASADWYARFAEHMKLKPIDFVMSYIMRSGRIDLARLRMISPALVARYEAAAAGR